MTNETNPIAAFQAAISDPLSFARRAKERGATLVGIAADVVPEEVILAAGATPHVLCPRLDADTPLANDLLSPSEDPILRSMFEQLAVETRGLLALTVLGPPYGQLSTMIEDVRRDGVLDAAPPTFFFEMLVNLTSANRAYATERTRALARRMAAVTGIDPAPDRLTTAVARTNRRREAMRDFTEKARASRAISGAEAFTVLLARRYMAIDDYVAQVEGLLADLDPDPELARLPGVLLVPSNALDHAHMHHLAEDAGLLVVAEDDPGGSRAPLDPILPGGDPIEAIAQYWLEHHAGQRLYPAARRLAWFRRAIEREDVEAVIFYAENPRFGWDLPAVQADLDRLGKPSLLVRADARKPAGTQAAREALAPFATTLRDRIAR